MNYFEFRKVLDADPYNQDADFVKAKNEDLRCRRAWQQAMQQERILKDALNIPVPAEFKSSIVFHQCAEKENSSRVKLYAMAASVFLMITLSLVFWNMQRGDTLESFIKKTLRNEPMVTILEEQIPMEQIQNLFAQFDTNISDQIGKVHFMKMCVTPSGMGVRMVVVNESNQPFTILYMPNADIEKAIEMEVNQHKGMVIAMEKGAAAIIGQPQYEFAQIEQNVFNAITAD
ncbi:DUF3379 family protein [Marinicella sp. W31]|uniref:DUF3379 family protein n=1 Tax=Marinicella sp. W31 TaxID=3023713 RepID=UPI0037569811